jgi:peptidoglycan/xylan/chitin deacetylase (PgdA/CDA1 family)
MNSKGLAVFLPAPASPQILAYHAVSSQWRSPLTVDLAAFREQAWFFKDRDFRAYTFVDAERHRSAGTLADRAVVFTFDDAFSSVWAVVPILDELGWPATIFAVTDFVDRGMPLQWPGMDSSRGDLPANETAGMTWDDLRELQAKGWEIGSHTCGHAALPNVDAASLRREVQESRERIAAEIGACYTIAYPYGIADDRVAAGALRAGYEAACTLTAVTVTDEQLLRPRLRLDYRDTGARLALKTSRVSTAAHRSSMAKAARRLRRHRPWIPD